MMGSYLQRRRRCAVSVVAEADVRAALNSDSWVLPEYRATLFCERRHDYALVIPVINEGLRIREQLQRIASAALPVDVVVADGGSTDGSLENEFVQAVGVRAVLVKTGAGRLSAQLRMAYSWCVQEGYSGVVTIDGNGKDNVEAVTDFVARLRDGFDYVQGSRYREGGKAEHTPLERTIGNRLIHAPLMSMGSGHWLTDTTNGYRGYSRRLLVDPRVAPFRAVFMNYELLFYLTVRSGQLGYRITEVPVCRSYPHNAAVPTKITGARAKIALLLQTIKAAAGRYSP